MVMKLIENKLDESPLEYEDDFYEFAQNIDRKSEYKIYRGDKLITCKDLVDNYFFTTMLNKSIIESKLVTILVNDDNYNNSKISEAISELFQNIYRYNNRYNPKGV